MSTFYHFVYTYIIIRYILCIQFPVCVISAPSGMHDFSVTEFEIIVEFAKSL